MPKKHTIKINLPGGIVAAGDLYSLALAAEKAGIENLQPGNRQQLYCKVDSLKLEEFSGELNRLSLFYETDRDDYPNIVSSYVAEDVFQNAHWLGESLYKDILSSFDYRPRMKISLVDAHQAFIPFYTGHINFISSPMPNYWYLYFRFPKTGNIFCWKGLIYSGDIARIGRLIENKFFSNRQLFYTNLPVGGELLYNMVHSATQFITQPVGEGLQLPAFALPYYEGFNRYGDKNWLGIYRRDELFPVPFLKEVAKRCLQTKTGQLYTTPWKSLIIKNIVSADRETWEYILGKYRINVHHAANELNWQVEDLNEEGLNLKRYLIRQFDKDDVRTYGLCFAIKTKPQSGLFGAVIIRKQNNESRNQLKALDRYDILYTKDFNPNTREYVLFRKSVKKENLGTYLISLCKYFYELQSKDSKLIHNVYRQEEEEPAKETTLIETKPLYQCPHCLTVYDGQYGDETNNIAAGTTFEELPAGYCCATCDAEKSEFVLKNDIAPVYT